MSTVDDAAVRLGLALYRRTLLDGPTHYSVESLVFGELEQEKPSGLFQRLFSQKDFDFWGQQEELAKRLAQSGLVDHYSRTVDGAFRRDHFIRLTALGRSLYDLAYSQQDASQNTIEGLTIEDALLVLRDEEKAHALSNEMEGLDTSLNQLHLSNFQRAAVNSYVNMLVVVCRMPDPDAKLFWTILNRLNQFAGVASLIVALIALRLAR